jgi:hypothetical protein
MIYDPDHKIAQRICRKANAIYGFDYRVDWAYIDNRNRIYNGSEYMGVIRNDMILFDRTPSDTVRINFVEAIDDE